MVRVLFVGGLGRSGTTLLERILGELSGVCPLGEVVHLWRRDLIDDDRCACGTRFSRCDFWQAVGERAFGGWDRVDVPRVLELRGLVDRIRYLPRLSGTRLPAGYRALVDEYVDGYYTPVYRSAAEVSGARVLIDSSKHSPLAYCLRRCTELDLRVVHMVRDPRAVAYSWTKAVSRPEASRPCPMTRYRPVRSALLWNAHNAAFWLLERTEVPVRRVRYESLLADPAGTVRSLAEFAGVPAGPLDFLVEGRVRLGPCHSAAGNPMRFAIGQIPLQRDEVWRTRLPAGQRWLVGALTAPLLALYGYGKR